MIPGRVFLKWRRAIVFAVDVEKSRSPNVIGSLKDAKAIASLSPVSTKVAAISVEKIKGFEERPAKPIAPRNTARG
jgi:hypothetical protein